MSEDALQDGDWVAVHQAVTERRTELHMSISYLAHETGLSPTTIRYLGTPAGKHNKSTLVALSAVLGWRHNHLVNILNGEPEKNIRKPENSPAEYYYENLLVAEVAPMREVMAELTEAVNGIGKKIDVIVRGLRADSATDVGTGDLA